MDLDRDRIRARLNDISRSLHRLETIKSMGREDFLVDEDSQEAHGKGDAGGVEYPGEDVPSENVGAEEKDVSLVGPEEVDVRLEETPETVLRPLDEELQPILLPRVRLEYPFPGVRVQARLVSVDEGTDVESLLVDEPKSLRRGVDEL